MNNKFFIPASFLIALLCHIALFNLITFVFSIDPAGHKPKFFFLGPILSQNDVRLTSTKEYATTSSTAGQKSILRKSSLNTMRPELIDQTENPFAIEAIKKPLIPQATDSQKKIVIKSTFELEPEKDAPKEIEAQHDPNSELKIQSYRPLRFRSP